MLKTETDQDIDVSTIEAANFGAIAPAAGRIWNTAYIDGQWQTFVQREAASFAVHAGTKEWLKGLNYSLSQNRFTVFEVAMLEQSLLDQAIGGTAENDRKWRVTA